MAQFLNERLPVYVEYGASFKQNHAVQITGVQNGDEYRKLVHPFIKLDYQFAYKQNSQMVLEEVVNFYQKANGSFRTFRVRDWADFSTKDFVKPPTPEDMRCIPCDVNGLEVDVATSFYSYAKLIRWYGDFTDPYCARRYIKKPVQGTVRVSKLVDDVYVEMTEKETDGEMVDDMDFTVDYTTGIIHTFQEFVDFESVIYAGCEFDIPCRFDAAPSFAIQDWSTLQGSSFAIIEVFNP